MVDAKYNPERFKDNIHEINLVYIGSSKCAFSNNPEVYSTVDLIKSELNTKANFYNVGFSAIGIAVDWDPMIGIDHLKKFGHFDEVITGNSWSNNGIIKYVGEMGQEPSTPQIIVTYRTYTKAIKTNVLKEKYVMSLSGKQEIINWYREGTPLPQKFIEEIQ